MNSVDILTVLLEHGSDPNLAHTVTGHTPLMRAVRCNAIQYVEVLLQHGADVMQMNNDGQTVLDLYGERAGYHLIDLCNQYKDINQSKKPLLK